MAAASDDWSSKIIASLGDASARIDPLPPQFARTPTSEPAVIASSLVPTGDVARTADDALEIPIEPAAKPVAPAATSVAPAARRIESAADPLEAAPPARAASHARGATGDPQPATTVATPARPQTDGTPAATDATPARPRTDRTPAATVATPAATDATPTRPRTDGTPARPPTGGVPARPQTGPNPFDEQVWRAEGGSDSAADLAGVRPVVDSHPMRASIAAFLGNKRNLAIVAGGALLLVFAIVLATGGSSDTSRKNASATKSGDSVATTEPAPQGSSADHAEPAAIESAAVDPTAGTSDGVAHTAGSAPAAESTAAPHTAVITPAAGADPALAQSHDVAAHAAAPARPRPAPAKKEGTLAGKQVVLEYDAQARDATPAPGAPKSDQAAISKARTAYAAGNTRLFAGDADGAIRNYRQALEYYPAYLAGYRGLGLAYAQKGDKPNALKALRTYISAAPNAKDAALIRKRIQTLSPK